MVDIGNESRIYAYAIFIAIVIGILGGLGVLKGGTLQTQKASILPCEERCKYNLDSSKAEVQNTWKYYLDINNPSEEVFESQKECIDYCSSKD